MNTIQLDLLIFAGAGALLTELIRLGKGPIADVFRTPGYWLQLAAQLLAAVLAAYFLAPPDSKAAFMLGAALPQTLTRLAAAQTPTAPTTPPAGGGQGRPSFNASIWWSR